MTDRPAAYITMDTLCGQRDHHMITYRGFNVNNAHMMAWYLAQQDDHVHAYMDNLMDLWF